MCVSVCVCVSVCAHRVVITATPHSPITQRVALSVVGVVGVVGGVGGVVVASGGVVAVIGGGVVAVVVGVFYCYC